MKIKYNVDPSSLINNDKKDFLQYLAYQTLSIDVWDGNTLHLIGTCTLELKQLLRHGKDAVQSTYELDVLSTEYDDEMTTGYQNGYTVGVTISKFFAILVIKRHWYPTI
jgi:nephrocystin-4